MSTIFAIGFQVTSKKCLSVVKLGHLKVSFQKVINKYELGIIESEPSDQSDTDFETSHSEHSEESDGSESD